MGQINTSDPFQSNRSRARRSSQPCQCSRPQRRSALQHAFLVRRRRALANRRRRSDPLNLFRFGGDKHGGARVQGHNHGRRLLVGWSDDGLLFERRDRRRCGRRHVRHSGQVRYGRGLALDVGNGDRCARWRGSASERLTEGRKGVRLGCDRCHGCRLGHSSSINSGRGGLFGGDGSGRSGLLGQDGCGLVFGRHVGDGCGHRDGGDGRSGSRCRCRCSRSLFTCRGRLGLVGRGIDIVHVASGIYLSVSRCGMRNGSVH